MKNVSNQIFIGAGATEDDSIAGAGFIKNTLNFLNLLNFIL